MANFTIRTTVTSKVATLYLSGSVSGNVESVELREQIGAATSDGVPWVVLDCTHLTFISSLGLGMVIASLTALRNRGGDLCLANVNDDIVESLTKTLLTRVIQIFDTTDQAVSTFSSRE